MLKKSKIDVPVLSKNLFPVVGVGASAGGLEAFKKLLHAIPEKSGMAYILVQHLSPDHESALTEILQKTTKIPVSEISDNVIVKPNHIYVIPPNKMLVATDGILKLSPRLSKDKLNLSIDLFFTSLSEVHQAHAIGVILSGTGTDGTAGLKNIQDHGGITIAQEPSSAAYDGMPQHAINAEAVDFILAVEEIPKQLIELKQNYGVFSDEDEPPTTDKKTEDGFRQILALIKIRMGVDFSFYKQTTIRRRITRRIIILKLDNLAKYLTYLKKNKQEQDLLFEDMLIKVTAFFRDTNTFDYLCQSVLPDIIKNKSSENPLRIWIAGCSTGQEAYSIVMCIQEYLKDHDAKLKVQIFATDMAEKSIKKARTGIYLTKEIEGLSDQRLHEFFDKVDGHFQVKKSVRDLCVFAIHNILKDPPFAKMDLITCRNVLIYFEPVLQKKALTIFHYALNDKGILLLGKAETAGNATDLFSTFGDKDKFYIRRSVPGRFINVIGERSETAYSDRNLLLRSKEGKTDDYQKNADEVILSKYAPVGVVVDSQLDIVQFRGHTVKYLEPSPGKASLNVLKMAKEGLSFEIRNALQKAKISGTPFLKEGIALNGENRRVTIEVFPLLNIIDLHFLILFKDEPLSENNNDHVGSNKKVGKRNKADDKDARIQQLEKELEQAREDMRSISEDHEASNEELQSANEELLSGSEELQSLNEELESSKEELQSMNEELVTLNQELVESNEEMNQSKKFTKLIISILHEPLLVLDKNFKIIIANASFYESFHLSEEETLGNILFKLQENSWEIAELRSELTKMLRKKETTLEIEISHTFSIIGERVICFNIQPIHHQTNDHFILMTLDDITTRKNAEEELKNQIDERIKLDVQKNNFISMASHELKTPVTSLKGNTQVLIRRFKDNANADASVFLGKMDKQIDRLTVLINDLLEATKFTSGQLKFKEEHFDFNDLVKEIVEEIQLTTENHFITTQMDHSKLVFGDRNRIGQVISNLLSNAIKYSPNSKKIILTVTKLDKEIKLSVKDFGIGISEENQAKVFDQFYRASNFHQGSSAGLGLGLYIASEIIKKHKGKLFVESVPDEGSEFSFTIPINR